MLSRTPSCSSPSTSLPTCASVCSAKPANTSISRRWNGRSASGMLSHDAIVSARGVNSAEAGIQPSCFWRAKTRWRNLSQPSSNFPLYLSAHSGKMWCGPWAAPAPST